jgi:hypothetical protein
MTMVQANLDAIREDWVHTINSLVNQISEWSQEENWTVEQQPRAINEETVGAYTAPDVTIKTPSGKLMLEVMGRGEPNGAGRVELAAWPTYFRVLLLQRPGQTEWTIRTDSGIPLRRPWNKETFVTLARDLLCAE